MESWKIFFNSANEEKLLQIIAEGERREGGAGSGAAPIDKE
jgi:hypothetical protein